MTHDTPTAIFELSELELFTLASIALHCAKARDGNVLRLLVEQRIDGSTSLTEAERAEALAWLRGESVAAAAPGGGD